jgi:acetyl-CoA carboxylase carboxyltransferase component
VTDVHSGAQDDGIARLLDPGSSTPFLPGRPLGALRATRGSIHGRSAIVVAIESGAKRGAIGVAEARALADVFATLTDRSLPLILLLSSSGARIDMGLEILAAFRELLAAALRASQRGVRCIAVVRSICYGGASMLACLAERRIFTPASRIAMSGPTVIAAMAGRAELDPDDAKAVQALIGGAARASLDGGDRLCADDDDALRAALADCLDAPEPMRAGIADKHRALFERLQRQGIEIPRNPKPSPPELKQRMDALLPGGFETVLGAGLVRGVRLRGGSEVTVTGIVGGAPLSAVTSWMLAESIVTSVRTRPERPIVILYDSPGHAMTRADEGALLSDYLVHLARTVQWAAEQGVSVSVWILGESSGGGYVTLTAACRSVLALPGADIRVLPQSAAASVLGDAGGEQADPRRWLRLGLIDSLLECDRLSEDAARDAGLPRQ